MDKKMINGVIVKNLKQIENEQGKVMHMLRSDDKIFKKFGEIYFSFVKPKVIKAWRKHKKMELNLVCIKGEIKLVLYDERKKSITYKQIQEIILSPKNYFLISVPSNIWYGFQDLSNSESIIANCPTIPHDDKEILRKLPQDSSIPYKW